MSTQQRDSTEVKESRFTKELKKFGQETTWHGIKQISEIRGLNSRKLAWIIVLLAAISAFSYAIGQKLAEYYEYDSQIEMVSTYEDSIKFPRVTVCNMNPYKMTSVVEAGLYDVLVSSVKAASSKQSEGPQDECSDYFVVQTNFCFNMRDAIFSKTYKEVTQEICSTLCIQLEPIRCAGFAYDRKTRLCILSSANDGKNDTCKDDMRIKYYIRQRCAVTPDINCDFESRDNLGQGVCSFESSRAVEDEFVRVQELDHTLATGDGHFLNLLESDKRDGYAARIETPFLYLNETCLQLFYGLSGLGEFRIILKEESLVEIVLSLGYDYQYYSNWGPFFLRIPHTGIYQVVIEANRPVPPPGFSLGSGVSIDDIRITSCAQFGMFTLLDSILSL